MNTSFTPDRISSVNLVLTTRPLVQLIRKVDVGVSTVGFVLNVLHFIVLSHRKMRSTAIFIIFWFISIADLILNVSQIIQNMMEIWSYESKGYCFPFESYSNRVITGINLTLVGTSSASSAWLTVLMSLFRVLSIKYPMASWVESLSKISVAVKTSCVVVAFQSAYNFLVYICKYSSITKRSPSNMCFGNGDPNKEEQYNFNDTEPIFIYIFTMFDGFMQAVSILLYINFSYVLIKSIKEAAKLKRAMIHTRNQQKEDKTSHLILCLIIVYFLSEMPLIVLNIVMIFAMENSVTVIYYAVMATMIASLLKSFTSPTHIFICYFMSSQYRNTVQSLLPIRSSRARVEDVTRQISQADS